LKVEKNKTFKFKLRRNKFL